MKEKTNVKSKPMITFVLFIAALLIIIGAVVLVVSNGSNNKEENEVPDEIIQESENQTLEESIEWDVEDAHTGFYLEVDRDDIYIGSVNLLSRVAEEKVIITFSVTAEKNITSPLTGTLVFQNDLDEVLDTLTFVIPVLNAEESKDIEIISNNLGTILTTNLNISIE